MVQTNINSSLPHAPEEFTMGFFSSILAKFIPGRAKEKKVAALSFDEVSSIIDANNNSDFSTELLTCLTWKESGWNPAVVNPRSGSTGLMQMTKIAVKDVNQHNPNGDQFSMADMKDPVLNIQCGSSYLQILLKRWNNDDITALNHFGTGPGYSDNILKCEACLEAGDDSEQTCLNAIHK